MEFKYLSESMSLDEARKAYRSLAKQLHPDIGGDEDEFKILAHEYSVIERRASESVIANISDIMEAAGAMVGVIAQTLRELYPRTRVVLNYTSSTIEAEFYGNVPVERMVAIEQVINSFGYPFSVIVLFKREEDRHHSLHEKQHHLDQHSAGGWSGREGDANLFRAPLHHSPRRQV